MGLGSAVRAVAATEAEVRAALPGDDLVADADSVMDRGFDVPAPPDQVWPWLLQLGKQRAGWYLTRRVEQLVPARRRASRRIEERWQSLAVGDVIPDYGGRDETFEAARCEAPHLLVYTSRRGRVDVSWAIRLSEVAEGTGHTSTRVHLRLRLGPIRRQWLVGTAGELIDVLTVAGMAAGLVERVEEASRPR